MGITTFLMFTGDAEAAMNHYVSLFPNAGIVSIDRYASGEQGAAGTVKQALFDINGVRLMCIDSPVPHPFTFTPSMSLFVDCDDETEVDRLFEGLSDGGQVLMPLNNYGFSRRFAWVQDKFGVSWQINLP